MMFRVLLLACLLLPMSILFTWFVRRHALARGIMDRPNLRSSHSVPTPRGGGLAIVLTVTCGSVLLWFWNSIDTSLFLAISGGGSLVALVGYIDDRRSIPAGIRIAIHFVAAIWAVHLLGGLHSVQWGSQVVDPGFTGDVLAVIGVVWLLNLFNFMDGIDGIAGAEAVFAALAGGALVVLSGASASVAAVCWLVAAATLGFLCWNWPPARIFMGDVGSGYLGYLFGVLALAAARESSAMLYVWMVLGGVFLTDATVTLLRRILRRERFYEAHRTHAYQKLAIRWRSHLRVTVVILLVDAAWLFPCAYLAVRYPQHSSWIAVIALTPLFVACLCARAGQREDVAP